MPMSTPSGSSALRRCLVAVAAEPRLWPVALSVGRGLVPRRWWARWPPLPLPDPAWLAFRMETAYGDRTAVPSAEDVVAYLRWCAAERAAQ
jgi:hypothetical protein